LERTGLRAVTFLIAVSVVFWFLRPEVSAVFLMFAAFLIYFYRDPEREIGTGVTSPADGRIVEASERKIEIFMGIFDCHVNRSPCDGVVEEIEYVSGRFFPAFLKRSRSNERNRIWIRSEDGVFVVEQIAGVFARRIICYLRVGERVKRGQRLGMIVFGSRVTLEIPEGYRFVVGRGDRVKAGQTVAVKDEKAH